ncbi:MAG: hypothetical protein U9R50_02825 [Campylobacterota bacterium]|nr:hypothetical protein [Campylobacterota bacterium]
MKELFDILHSYLDATHQHHCELQEKHAYSNTRLQDDTQHHFYKGVAYGLRTALEQINALEALDNASDDSKKGIDLE